MELSEDIVAEVVGRPLDPSASLSNSDIVQLLIKYSSLKVESRVEELKVELKQDMRDDRNRNPRKTSKAACASLWTQRKHRKMCTKGSEFSRQWMQKSQFNCL